MGRSACELRRIRQGLRLSQAVFAARLGVSAHSYRPWDSGRRIPPEAIVDKARSLLQGGDGLTLLMGLLAAEFRIHVPTLRAAARDRRLVAKVETRSYFGHAVASATGRAVRTFVKTALS